MRLLLELTWTEFRRFLRRPPDNVLGLGLPVLVLVVLGVISGNAPSAEYDGYGATDRAMPGQLAAILGAAGLIVAPPPLVALRRRLLSPGAPQAHCIAAQALVDLFVALLGALLVLTLGFLAFGLRSPRAPLAAAAAFALSCCSILALGFVLGALARGVTQVRGIGLVFFFLNLMLSGSAIPSDQLPASARRVGLVLPLTHVRILLHDLWFGNGWNPAALAIVVVLLLASVGVSARLYDWS